LSGGAAAVPAGLGAAAVLPTEGLDAANTVLENQSRGLTFQPRTKQGQQFAQILSKPLEAVADAIDRFAEKPIGVIGGGPRPSASPLTSTAVKTTVLGIPAIVGTRGRPTILTGKEQVAKSAVDAGFKLPPGDVSSKISTTSLQGFADASKTRQAASFQNIDVVNRLTNRALKRADDAPLSLEDMKAYRAEQGQRYNAINDAGTIATDKVFFDALDASVKDIKKAAPSLRGKDSSAFQAIEQAEGLKTSHFDASSVAPTTRFLRELADEAFDGKRAQSGRAYRAMANAYEEAALRHMERFGSPRAVAEFRQARQNIATSYTVQDALEGINVNAHKIRTKRRKDVPLQPELDLIARVAEEFPKATRLVTEGPQGLTFIDGLVALGALSSPSPLLNAFGIATLAKPGIRAGLISGPVQRGLLPQSVTRPGVLPGIIGSGIAAQQGLLGPRPPGQTLDNPDFPPIQ
jgi:hypothetical protein